MRRTSAAWRICALGVSAAVLGTGCNAFGDDVAATVDGIDITWAQVNSLSTGLSQVGVTDACGVADGANARAAVSRLVYLGVVQAELKRRNVEITDADRSAARDQVTSDQSESSFYAALDDAGKAVELDFVASQKKVQTTISALDPESPEVQASLLDHLDGLAEVKCVDIVQVPKTGPVDEVEAKLKTGAPAAEVAAADPTNVQEQRVCLNEIARAGLSGTEVLDAEPGSVTRQDGTTQDGTEVVGFLRPTGPLTLAVGDPALPQVIQRMQTVNQQTGEQKWLEYAVRSATVALDPRLGTWSTDSLRALAPALPLDRTPTTTTAVPTLQPEQPQPTETQPTETQPTETQPTETQPTETQPTETQPTQGG